MDAIQILVVCLAASASAIIKNGAAVGSGVFLLPVLALVFPPKIALGLGAPIMLASDIMGLRNYWREWGSTRDILLIIVPAGVGIVLGSFFLQMIPGDVFKIGIGLFAVGYSLCNLNLRKQFAAPRATDDHKTASTPASERKDGQAWPMAIGFMGGVATILAHAGGMVWSMYYLTKEVDKRRFVGALVLLFALSNVMKLIAYMQLDILTMQSNLIVLAMAPIIILSSNLGNYLNKRVGQHVFRRVVLVLILVVGVDLMFR